MSSLSFLPRKLTKGIDAQKSGACSAKAGKSGESASGITLSDVTRNGPATSSNGTALPEYDDQDSINLLSLSLSDFALWLDVELRQQLGYGPTQGPDTSYIPLDYLLEHSAVLSGLCSHTDIPRSQVQRALVKAIRLYASHLFDVQLTLHLDETVPRFGKQKEVGGGYEIRRKCIDLKSKAAWDACTLYIENIPPGYRSYAKIIRLLNHLLRDAPSMSSTSIPLRDSLTRVQGILFPPHYNDKPDMQPSCKGFAFVTLAHTADCDHLKENWPWIRDAPSDFYTDQFKAREGEGAISSTDPLYIARQHNLRVISKEGWLQLKAEYLDYRKKLVEELNISQDAQQRRSRGMSVVEIPGIMNQGSLETNILALDPPPKAAAPISSLNLSSPYPPDCLVFVRNVHPETTKTTLRTLFSRGLRQSDASAQKSVEGLDYVDFSKGMDTCYLRLTTSSYTAALVDYHRIHPIAQVSGMDETGTEVSSTLSHISTQTQKPIVVERVTGRPEEIYWDKVPLKVRKAAVERAMQLVEAVDRESVNDSLEVRKHYNETGRDELPRRNKRRKSHVF